MNRWISFAKSWMHSSYGHDIGQIGSNPTPARHAMIAESNDAAAVRGGLVASIGEGGYTRS